MQQSGPFVESGGGRHAAFVSPLTVLASRDRLRRALGKDISYVVNGARTAFRLVERDDGDFDLERIGLFVRTFATLELRAHHGGSEATLRLRPPGLLGSSALLMMAPLVLLFAGLAIWQLAVQAFAAAVILAMFAVAIWLVAAHVSRAALNSEVDVLRSEFASMLGSASGPAPASIPSPRPAEAPTEDARLVVAIDEASMRRRGAALLLDVAVIAVLFFVVNEAVGRIAPAERATSTQQFVGLLVWTGGSAAYFFGSWLLGATPAMRLLGIGIVGRDGGGPGLVRSLIRLVIFAVEITLIAFVTLIYLGLVGGPLEEGLVSWATVLTWPALAAASLLLLPANAVPHDRMAGTRVIRLS